MKLGDATKVSRHERDLMRDLNITSSIRRT